MSMLKEAVRTGSDTLKEG